MAKTRGTGGFPSIFRNKKGGTRYQGTLRKAGSKDFERARARLSKLAGQKATDADVMEYLAIGEDATKVYLDEVKARKEQPAPVDNYVRSGAKSGE